MKRDPTHEWRSSAANSLLAGGAFVLLTLFFLSLKLNVATAGFAYLILIALASLWIERSALIALSLAAAGCLDFFFATPPFTLWIENRSDAALIFAFLAASLVSATLLGRARRRAEEAVSSRQAETELRAAIDTIPALVWTAFSDGANDFHNKRLLSYTNRSLEQLKGEGWTTMFHPDDVPGQMEAWRVAVTTGAAFEFESRLRRFDGAYRWFLSRAEPLRDEHGNIVKWYGTNDDIEDRKQAEKALRRSEAYLAEAQRLSLTGSFGWTPSTGEIHWSDESFRIFEFHPTVKPTIELVLQRIHPDDRAFMRRAIDEASGGERDFNVTHRLLMPGGAVKYVHVRSHAVKDELGNLEIVGALMDVTATKRAEHALRENEQRWHPGARRTFPRHPGGDPRRAHRLDHS